MSDYYTYDGDYLTDYYLGDPFIISYQSFIQVDWYDLDQSKTMFWLRLTDWFRQDWYTEAIEMYFDRDY